jgi:hypothetical protein
MTDLYVPTQHAEEPPTAHLILSQLFSQALVKYKNSLLLCSVFAPMLHPLFFQNPRYEDP